MYQLYFKHNAWHKLWKYINKFMNLLQLYVTFFSFVRYDCLWLLFTSSRRYSVIITLRLWFESILLKWFEINIFCWIQMETGAIQIWYLSEFPIFHLFFLFLKKLFLKNIAVFQRLDSATFFTRPWYLVKSNNCVLS